MEDLETAKPRIVKVRPKLANHVTLFVSLSIIILAFFILLNAYSSYDEIRIRRALTSIQLEFVSILPSRGTPLMDGQGFDLQTETPQTPAGDDLLFRILAQHYEQIAELQVLPGEGGGLGRGIGIVVTPRGIVVTLGAELTYLGASARLSDTGRDFLDRLSAIISPYKNQIVVEGHTDSSQPQSGPYRNNWELSQARAMSVLRHLVMRGIDPDRISAAGAAEFRPIADNATAEGRALNRRVEIILTHPRLRAREE